MNRNQQTVVCERVAGTRHFSVAGSSPLSHDPYREGTRSTICLWSEDRSYVKSESYGREFANDDYWREFCLTHGYTRLYFTSPTLRISRVAKTLGFSHIRQAELVRMPKQEQVAWLARYRRATRGR